MNDNDNDGQIEIYLPDPGVGAKRIKVTMIRGSPYIHSPGPKVGDEKFLSR